MAEKRMISKSISISEKVNLLPEIFDMLLFTWIVPHTDDFGRLTGSPAKIKALVVPMLDKTIKEIASSLQNIHDAGLIYWYEINSEKFIQVINFEKHQTGLNKRTKSKLPEFLGNSEKFLEIPPELNRTELNRTELNRREEEENRSEKQSHNFLPLINQLGLKCKGVWEMEQVESYLSTMTPELIEEALKRSEHKLSVAYSLGILSDWLSKGFKTIHDIKPKAVPDRPKKEDPELESRKIEVARSRWIQEGNDPNEFEYIRPTGA